MVSAWAWTSIGSSPKAAAGDAGGSAGVGGDLRSGRITEWRAGRRIRVPVTLRRPATYLDPGVADSQRDFAWKGTSLVGSVMIYNRPLSPSDAMGLYISTRSRFR
jgi:hypothetical protein